MPDHMMSFILRLPTSAEYDEMLRVCCDLNDRCHWQAIWTLCQDASPVVEGCRIARGFMRSCAMDAVPEDFHNARLGFRPFLEMRGKDPFPCLKDGDTVSFGLLTLDGVIAHVPTVPVAPTSLYKGDIPKAYDARVSMVSARFPHTPITWIKQEGGYIADRVLLCKISWSALDKGGFMKGKLMQLRHPEYRPNVKRPASEARTCFVP